MTRKPAGTLPISALACMRALRWFGSFLLVLVGLLLVVPGLYIAFTSEWRPTQKLHEGEIARIRMASTFVEKYGANTGRLPTTDEFRHWADTAPSELRLDGVGFTYLKRDETIYTFDWHGGSGTWLWWRSQSDFDLANVSPRDYFIFGSKLADLVVFLGLGVVAIWAATLAAPGRQNA